MGNANWKEDIDTHAPKLLMAVARARLNGACKMALATAKSYKNESYHDDFLKWGKVPMPHIL